MQRYIRMLKFCLFAADALKCSQCLLLKPQEKCDETCEVSGEGSGCIVKKVYDGMENVLTGHGFLFVCLKLCSTVEAMLRKARGKGGQGFCPCAKKEHCHIFDSFSASCIPETEPRMGLCSRQKKS